MRPKTCYAKSGDVHIAYQVFGEGEIDIVCIPGFVTNLEMFWEIPEVARFLERLASFGRVMMLDKRGTGLSDRGVGLPTLEERMDDLRAVMDAAGSKRAALLGWSEGGPMSILFSATWPDRTAALVLWGSFARFTSAPDHPWGFGPEQIQGFCSGIEVGWGKGAMLPVIAPSRARDARVREQFGRWERFSAGPRDAIAIIRMNTEIDVRHVLNAVRVPTLVLHRKDDNLIPVGASRYIAERIPGAKYVEQPGDDHLIWYGDTDAALDAIEEFLTGSKGVSGFDRVLATVLFTDIVDATSRAVALGDRGWRELLSDHHARVRRELAQHRGTEVDTAGDGFFATFDGPARAIRCARGIVDAVRPLGLEVRAGLHTGECELDEKGVAGIAVHIGARIAALAEPGEALVSSTVKDLVAGSGIGFADRGSHALKGVPGEWRLYRVIT